MVLENEKKTIGRLGEEAAIKYLEKEGYKILDRNYHLRSFGGPDRGEIDIIAKDKNAICFIEVKTVTDEHSFFSTIFPEQKINLNKKNKMIKTATTWLMEKKLSLATEQRMDIIVLNLDLINKKAKIRHLKNAF